MYNLIFVVGALVVLAIVMIVFWCVDLKDKNCRHENVATKTLSYHGGLDGCTRIVIHKKSCLDCGEEETHGKQLYRKEDYENYL